MGQIEMEKPGSSGSLLDGNQQLIYASGNEVFFSESEREFQGASTLGKKQIQLTKGFQCQKQHFLTISVIARKLIKLSRPLISVHPFEIVLVEIGVFRTQVRGKLSSHRPINSSPRLLNYRSPRIRFLEG